MVLESSYHMSNLISYQTWYYHFLIGFSCWWLPVVNCYFVSAAAPCLLVNITWWLILFVGRCRLLTASTCQPPSPNTIATNSVAYNFCRLNLQGLRTRQSKYYFSRSSLSLLYNPPPYVLDFPLHLASKYVSVEDLSRGASTFQSSDVRMRNQCLQSLDEDAVFLKKFNGPAVELEDGVKQQLYYTRACDRKKNKAYLEKKSVQRTPHRHKATSASLLTSMTTKPPSVLQNIIDGCPINFSPPRYVRPRAGHCSFVA
ncbi:hypothetical protein GQX74_009189 [Glossina fuscipes]|nr:hypothetical protein GQX74_009189 [Glossina fuscipes]